MSCQDALHPGQVPLDEQDPLPFPHSPSVTASTNTLVDPSPLSLSPPTLAAPQSRYLVGLRHLQPSPPPSTPNPSSQTTSSSTAAPPALVPSSSSLLIEEDECIAPAIAHFLCCPLLPEEQPLPRQRPLASSPFPVQSPVPIISFSLDSLTPNSPPPSTPPLAYPLHQNHRRQPRRHWDTDKAQWQNYLETPDWLLTNLFDGGLPTVVSAHLSILEHQYLIKWKGYSSSDNTW